MNTFKYLENLSLFIHTTYVFKSYIGSIFILNLTPNISPISSYVNN